MNSLTRRETVRRLGLIAAALWAGTHTRWLRAAAAEAGGERKTVWGIAELFEWVYRLGKSSGRDTEDCLQAHLDCGIRHVIWAVGRSAVDYHGKLPASTLYVGDSRPETKVIGDVMKQRCSLRAALAGVEKRTGRKVPVMARVDDPGLDVNLMEGMDVATWLKEKLVDELCTDPLWWLRYDYPDTITPDAKLARARGVKLWGGVGCLAAAHTRVNPVSFLRRVKRQYDESAAGVALYQSDTGIRDAILKPVLPKLGDPAAVAALLADKEWVAKWPQDEKSRYFGLDNHSKIEALGGATAPMDGL